MARLRRDERGTGLIGTWAGFVVFLALLLFAVQVMFNLWSTSAVTAAAADAARKVATADDPSSPAVQQQAESDARAILGRYATDHVRPFRWQITGDGFVELKVAVERQPHFFLAAVPALIWGNQIHRTVRVRIERFR